MPMPESSIIEINLSAVSHNLAVMRDMVGEGCMLCPVVKADAYGLGAVRIAKRMASSGAEMLAVFSPEQAAALAVAAIDVPVLVLMPVRDFSRGDDLYRMLVSGLLHLTVHDLRHLEELRRLAEKFAAVVPVHLEVDTGMSRGGCLPEEAGEVLRRAFGRPNTSLSFAARCGLRGSSLAVENASGYTLDPQPQSGEP